MSTLSELQARMAGTDQADAVAAGNELANYFLIYNDEYNTLLMEQHDAESALFDASHDPAGVDHAEVLHLQGLLLGIQARMKMQDSKMIAFRADDMTIAAPDDDTVKQVKSLCDQVATIAARGDAIEDIAASLGEIATIVNQVQAG